MLHKATDLVGHRILAPSHGWLEVMRMDTAVYWGRFSAIPEGMDDCASSASDSNSAVHYRSITGAPLHLYLCYITAISLILQKRHQLADGTLTFNTRSNLVRTDGLWFYPTAVRFAASSRSILRLYFASSLHTIVPSKCLASRVACTPPSCLTG